MSRPTYPSTGGSYQRLPGGALQRIDVAAAPLPAPPQPEPTLDTAEASQADAGITANPEE